MKPIILFLLTPHLPPLSGHAYLDPGSGSFLLQLLIAGLVGFAFILRGYWNKIKAFFKRSSKTDVDIEDESDDG